MDPSDRYEAATRPKVAILLASFNGEAWIRDQIDSALSQRGVEVQLFVSDDGSTDATQSMIRDIASSDSRVHWACNPHPLGSAATNFYHMIRTLDLGSFDYVAFADQDDIWLPGKLARQVNQLAAHGADGTSSDLIAFWASGRVFYLKKSFPQRRYDYIFESPGPGCTMLMTPRLLCRLRALLHDRTSLASSVSFHDWLAYAVARSSGWKWHIAEQPTLLYRQHQANEFGVNHGTAALRRRIDRYLSGAYTRDCRAVLSVAAECAKSVGMNFPPISAVNILLHGRRRLSHRLCMAMMLPRGLSFPK